MSPGTFPVLLGVAGFAALAIPGAGLLLLDARGRVLAQRTTTVLKPYTRTSASAPALQSRLARGAGKDGLPERLGRLLDFEADRPDIYPVKWWVVLPLTGIVGFAAARAVVFLVGDPGWLAWPITWILVSRWVFGFWRTRYRNALLADLPNALSMIVRSVRAGVTIGDAFQIVAREAPPRTAHEFAILQGDLSVGVMLDEALWKLAVRTGLREYRFLAVALSLQTQTGGNITEALENLADVIRKRAALRQRGKALSSEARATAAVLTALPFLTGGALFVISPEYMALLFSDPLGKKIFFGVIGFLFCGLMTMRSMIKRSLS